MNDGFKQVSQSENRYMKLVSLDELEFVFEKKTKVLYKGDEFIGSIKEGNLIMLYLRDINLGKKHQMNMRDKDEYYLYVDLVDL